MGVALKTRRFTVEEYHRMAAAGILSGDERVELLAGDIVDMAPIGPLHAGTVGRLTALLTARLGARAVVWVQNPLLLRAEHSEPQPDVTLLRPRADFYTQAHPEAPDVYLLLEVADTSVDKDRDVKFPLYARAGIGEAWLLDVSAGYLEVHRQPGPDGYQEIHRIYRSDTVTPQALPDLSLAVDDLLGPSCPADH